MMTTTTLCGGYRNLWRFGDDDHMLIIVPELPFFTQSRRPHSPLLLVSLGARSEKAALGRRDSGQFLTHALIPVRFRGGGWLRVEGGSWFQSPLDAFHNSKVVMESIS